MGSTILGKATFLTISAFSNMEYDDLVRDSEKDSQKKKEESKKKI
jgi:hypothetical protein